MNRVVQVLALLFAGAASGCATHTPYRDHYVQAGYPRSACPPLRLGGLDDRELSLQADYLDARELAAPRHEKPWDLLAYQAEGEALRATYARLREHYARAVSEDLEQERLLELRLRLLDFLPLAIAQLGEEDRDRYREDPSDYRALASAWDDPDPHGLYRLQQEAWGALDRLRDHDLPAILGDDDAQQSLERGLAAAFFTRDEHGYRASRRLSGRLGVLRRRLQLASARATRDLPTTQAEQASAGAQRAQRAAGEAEDYRDVALDAALDARVATESAALHRGD
jgi:hypothetical protein